MNDYKIGYGKPPKSGQFKRGNPYVDWERPVEQAFGPTERHHLHDILGRSGIRFPPPFARIHEGAEANSGNMAGGPRYAGTCG
jgi:hypothetical protein